MEHNYIYQFFNNASIAATLSITVGFFLAKYIYRTQKTIDRKDSNEEKLIEDLFLLKEHCKAVNRTFDILSNTYQTIVADGDDKMKQLFSDSARGELTKASQILMYSIPEDVSKMESIISIYYSDNELVKNASKEVFKELKIWHDFVTLLPIGKNGKKIDLTKRVSEVPEFSLEKLDVAIRELVTHLKV